MKYLVIVESPAKTQKIQSYLNTINGHNFIVAASMGHIRTFADGLKSIDIDNDYNATYSIINGKKSVVNDLKSKCRQADEVIIATDPDREGEAIGYHLVNVLGLSPQNTKRMTFNEITKPAIINAFNNIHRLDDNLYNAQEARSILDILIGFKISPVLWKWVQPQLSAGRCQSPALRLVYDRDMEIDKFKSSAYFNLTATFPSFPEIVADYHNEFKDSDEVVQLMPKLIKLTYELNKLNSKKHTQQPPAPYITSSIQQDASNKLGLSPKITMNALQKLYEKGAITYMRTDSTTISANFQKDIQKWIEQNHPSLYQKRDYHKRVANAQEAHECIRPVDVDTRNLDGAFTSQEKKLYNMIWIRTVASQMKPCITESTEYKWIAKDKNEQHIFTFSLSRDIELGYKVIYDKKDLDDSKMLEKLDKVKSLKEKPIELKAKEKFTKPPSRYNEASLIKALEDLGIGRPSTYSSIISTLLDRSYVIKDSNSVDKKLTREYTLKSSDNDIQETHSETTISSEKNRLVLTPIGQRVCEFMNENFDAIQSYDLTKDIEDELDEVANGNKSKKQVIDKMYKLFNPTVEKLIKDTNTKSKKETGGNDMSRHKLLGNHPKNNNKIYLYYGRFGACIAEDTGEEKMKFTSIPKDMKNEIITLEDAIALLQFPKILGKHADNDVILKNGPYGAYVEWGQTRIPLSKIGKTIHNVSLSDLTDALDSGEHSMTTLKEYTDGLKIMQNAKGVFIRKGDKMAPISDDKDWSKMNKTELSKILSEYEPKRRKFIPYKK
jgi:DNA topoisomerase-1